MEHRERFKFEDIEHILMNFKRWLKKAGKSLAKCVGRNYYVILAALITAIVISQIVYWGMRNNALHREKESQISYSDSVAVEQLCQQYRIEDKLDTICHEISLTKDGVDSLITSQNNKHIKNSYAF